MNRWNIRRPFFILKADTRSFERMKLKNKKYMPYKLSNSDISVDVEEKKRNEVNLFLEF